MQGQETIQLRVISVKKFRKTFLSQMEQSHAIDRDGAGPVTRNLSSSLLK
jgi:hypothetical protein